MKNEFQLSIYTWPPLRGVECKCRESRHDSPQDAITHLKAQKEPYALAVLSRSAPGGVYPCDWGGNFIEAGEWPQHRGTNGEHPAYLAVMADWQNLLRDIQCEAKTSREGTFSIARRLLSERHPQATGLTERLGREAAEL